MEAADEERAPLLLPQPQPPPQEDADSEYTGDGSVDINNQPALKRSTGNWRACFMILGVEFSENLAFYGISKNLVTYLTKVLRESKVNAARNSSAWSGACYLTPLFGAFLADTYWGKYRTVLTFLPLYILGLVALMVSTSLPASMTSSDAGHQLHSAAVYVGLYLVAFGNGGVKPCTSAFGADQFDGGDAAELRRKGSFFNWYTFMINSGSLLASTVLVWLQDNVGWGVSFVIVVVVMAFFFAVFFAGSKVYRYRPVAGSPLTGLSRVVVAAGRKWRLELPEDSSLLHEDQAAAAHRIKHTDQFRFLDKAAIVVTPSSGEKAASPWRQCTVTQVEELKMVLRLCPIWVSLVLFFSVSSQMSSTLVEQGMAMDNHVGSFSVPPASLSTFHSIGVLLWIPVYDAVLVPLARRVTGKPKGITQLQRIGVGLALAALIMAYSALVEERRLAAAHTGAAPISIMWQVPAQLLHGAAVVFTSIGKSEFFYDQAPRGMRSLCTALGQLAIAAGNYLSAFLLAVVASATASGGAPGWIPDDLNKGHLDYFFWLMAALLLLDLAFFIYCAMRYKVDCRATSCTTQERDSLKSKVVGGQKGPLGDLGSQRKI
ncbi:protein NRT1/ PTR FAMILY 8.3-like [Oryza brachyantha]|uniref:protein NRT1/ PTR FAMILY 8.3-like n=1 Tax=Oryza brachyantha TaxID=4533 RepID=UPI0007760F7F|nr:protein NRT1/ PTR FAMILY 8.3-like [Oryza brachyantha]